MLSTTATSSTSWGADKMERHITVAEANEIIATFQFLYIALVDRLDKRLGMSFMDDLANLREGWRELNPSPGPADSIAVQIFEGMISMAMDDLRKNECPSKVKSVFTLIAGGKQP